jgi:hypothetical protein
MKNSGLINVPIKFIKYNGLLIDFFIYFNSLVLNYSLFSILSVFNIKTKCVVKSLYLLSSLYQLSS